MASEGKKRIRGGNSVGDGIMARVTESSIVKTASQALSEAGHVAKKLGKSTGKAAWIAGTTFLVLVLPLIIEMDREQQFNDIELQQQSLLGAPPASPQ